MVLIPESRQAKPDLGGPSPSNRRKVGPRSLERRVRSHTASAIYVFVRTDIPVVNQLIQVGHACWGAGRSSDSDHPSPHLVLLAVESETHLALAAGRAEQLGVKTHLFYEPDPPCAGYTAACTDLVDGEGRGWFQEYRLWRSP